MRSLFCVCAYIHLNLRKIVPNKPMAREVMSSDRSLSCFFSNKFKNSFMAIATVAVGIVNSCPILAQITPDTSLGDESSVVTPGVEIKGETADRIDGGAIRDRSLFHSFFEFNIDAAQRVYFANPENIEQIFTRVTGNNLSNINGTLGVDGAADLLLLNPNGIIFGENSSLDIEGSFFGTSAEGVLFEDETEFSAVGSNSSLVTISVPVGLQMGNPGSISARSSLEVGSGQNFSLVGGEINLIGGSTNADENGFNISAEITAVGGKVEGAMPERVSGAAWTMMLARICADFASRRIALACIVPRRCI